MARVLIAGCGYVGVRLGMQLVERGHSVWAARRRPSVLPQELRPAAVDLMDGSGLDHLPFPFATIFYTAAAGESSENAYVDAYVRGPQTLLRHLSSLAPSPTRLVYCSSTSVYGENQGEHVDEKTLARPEGFRGQRVLEGEELFRASGLETVSLRLGGIYGPGRTRLIEAVRSGAASRQADGDAYTNRIHRNDAAAALAHLMNLQAPAQLYLGVDEEPALRSEVHRWLAVKLGVESAVVPPAARQPMGKRCSSRRLRDTGFHFEYPTYRQGYSAQIAEEFPELGDLED